MKTTYQYRLRPTKQQITTLEEWLETCRRTYNRMLGERCDWWENNRCSINSCSIISCGIAPLKDKPSYYSQQDSLVPLKARYPDIKLVQSQVLQNVVKRVDLAVNRFVAGETALREGLPPQATANPKGDSSSKRSGKPRFKGKGRYRSLTFTQMKQTCLSGNRITLPKLGVFKLVVHRPIPDGFKLKTATVVRQADGWYVSLSLQDDTVPTLSPNIKALNVIGIDVGLKEFLVTSEGETVPIPQFARKSEKRRKVLNKSLSRKKKKGTRRRQKAVKRLSKHYQKVARQRKDFHYKTANQLLSKYDVIAHEDLNIKGLAKSENAKSILDAGWNEFLSIVTVKSLRYSAAFQKAADNTQRESAGRVTVAVPCSGTTQRCSGCDTVVPKTLADRWHSCSCGVELDRDLNAAINIKKLALGHQVSKARGDLCNSRSVKREALGGFGGQSTLPADSARPIPLCG